jgi:hypothetical protein
MSELLAALPAPLEDTPTEVEAASNSGTASPPRVPEDPLALLLPTLSAEQQANLDRILDLYRVRDPESF